MSKKKLTKEVASIDFDDDDEVGYDEFSQFMDEHTSRQKNKAASEISEIGDSLLDEIDEKKVVQDEAKEKLIKYIVSKTKKYSPKTLREYDIYDVREIHKEVKHKNRSWFKKFLELFS